MKHLVSFIALSIVLCVISCSHNSEKLDSAWRLMDSLPDSALTILNSIDPEEISRAEVAHHALLLSMALDKNRIDLTSDSIAEVAYRYYCEEGNGSDDDRMLAAYAMAVICRNSDRDYDGFRYAKEAEHYGENSGDFFRKGFVYRIKSVFAAATYNYNIALESTNKAAAFFLMAGKKRYHDYEQWTKGIIYHNMGKYSTAIHILDSLQSATDDPYLASLTRKSLGVSSYAFYAYPQAKKLLKLLSKEKEFNDFELNSILSRIYFEEGKVDSGQMYLDSALMHYDDPTSKQIIMLDILAKKYESLQMTDSLVVVMMRSGTLLDSINAKTFGINSELLTENIAHYTEFSFKRKLQKQQTIILILCCVLLILIVSTAYYFLLFQKRKKSFIEKLSEMEDKNNHLYTKIQEVEICQKDLTEKLSFSEEKEESYLNYIMECYNLRIRRLLKKSDPNILQVDFKNILGELELFINSTRDNTVKHFDSHFPDAKYPDRAMFILIASGISTDIIIQILNTSKDAFNNRKSRMKKRIIEKTGTTDFNFVKDCL